jgi:hypothetical protein
MFLICSHNPMATQHCTDPFLTIPAPPYRAGRPRQGALGWDDLWEASLAGLLALPAAWVLAELVSALAGF